MATEQDPLLAGLGIQTAPSSQPSAQAAPAAVSQPGASAALDPLLAGLGIEPASTATQGNAAAAQAGAQDQKLIDEQGRPYRLKPGSQIRFYDDTGLPQKNDPNMTRITISGVGSTAEPSPATEQQGTGGAATAPAGLGEQLGAVVSDFPRQLGLTARYGVEGIGDTLNFLATPLRALGNGVNSLNDAGVAALGLGNPHHEAIQPVNFSAIADSLSLPKPRNAAERIAGDAARMVASAVVPFSVGAKLASGTPGVAQGVGNALAASPGKQLISGAAAGAAGGAVREDGGGPGAQLLASLAAGVAAPMAAGKVQQLGNAIPGAARNLFDNGSHAAEVSQQLRTATDTAVNAAIKESGLTLADLPYNVQAGLRTDVEQALKTGENLSPAAVQRLADYRLTGTTPTNATLSLDPAAVSQQKNLAKLGINSKDVAAQQLAQVENANNKQLVAGLNNLGAGATEDTFADGGKLIDALIQRNNQAQKGINYQYALARASDGRSALLDHEAFVANANKMLDQQLLGGKVPADVRKILNRNWNQVVQNRTSAAETGAAAGADGVERNIFNVENVEQMKTALADLQRISTNGPEIRALGLVRQALDEAPLIPGQQIGQEAINAFNKARGDHREWMTVVENTPALQAIRAGAEPDKFVQQFVIGNTNKANFMGVAQLKNQIADNPDAMNAVRRQITGYLKSIALNGASDEVGNFSQSSYNKALESIGDRKLRLFFPQEDLAQLKAIGRVASYEQFQPRGSAVNNSNTASAGLATVLDRIGNHPALSKIPFGKALAEPAQNIAVGMKSKAAMDVPQALITPSMRPKSPVVPASAVLPGLLMQGREDD